MNIRCCKDCQRRHPACHDTCEDYKEAKRLHEADKAAYKERYRVARSSKTIKIAHQKLKEGGRYGK